MTLLNVLFGAVIPPLACAGWWLAYRLLFRRRYHFLRGWIGASATPLIFNAIVSDWPVAAGNAVSLAVAICVWWWNRRKRDRAKGALGAKTRAIIDGMVRKVREPGKPRRLLRPVPGGAS